MTQEDKKLLLIDLCARLPYNVMVDYESHICVLNEIDPACKNIDYITVRIQDVERLMYAENVMIENIKPYLRPMSSMTEEEKKDILQSLNIHGDIDNEGNLLLGVECDIITLKVCKKYLGELNKHMFDVCHMIEKGLAIEVTEENNPYKK